MALMTPGIGLSAFRVAGDHAERLLDPRLAPGLAEKKSSRTVRTLTLPNVNSRPFGID
jgi:hypothetical protein